MKNVHVQDGSVCDSLKPIPANREGRLRSGPKSSHCVGIMLIFPRTFFTEQMQVIEWGEKSKVRISFLKTIPFCKNFIVLR